LIFSEKNSISSDFSFVDTLRLLLSCMSSTDPLLMKVVLLMYRRLYRYIITREFSIKFTASFAVW